MTHWPLRRLRRRLLPMPLTSVLLALAWPMLNASLSTGHLLLAATFAIGVPWLLRDWRRRAPPRRLSWRLVTTTLRLGLRVFVDVVVANVDVARRVLGPEAALQSRFVHVPVALRGPGAVATLAGIVTLTPGTVSCEVTGRRRWLLVHALHCTDPQALVASIKEKYEAPLMEIFGR